jgi:hypothetical protein
VTELQERAGTELRGLRSCMPQAMAKHVHEEVAHQHEKAQATAKAITSGSCVYTGLRSSALCVSGSDAKSLSTQT